MCSYEVSILDDGGHEIELVNKIEMIFKTALNGSTYQYITNILEKELDLMKVATSWDSSEKKSVYSLTGKGRNFALKVMPLERSLQDGRRVNDGKTNEEGRRFGDVGIIGGVKRYENIERHQDIRKLVDIRRFERARGFLSGKSLQGVRELHGARRVAMIQLYAKFIMPNSLLSITAGRVADILDDLERKECIDQLNLPEKLQKLLIEHF